MIQFGIEHEFLLKNNKDEILDYSNSNYETFKQIVDEFPIYKDDINYFHIKSTEKIPKRCYIEGFEIHNIKGEIIKTIPKGLEIRTTPHYDVNCLITEFKNSLKTVDKILKKYKLTPVLISFHPFKSKFDIPENILEFEKNFRTEKELKIAMNSMFTFGIHINFSSNEWNDLIFKKNIKKLNYYLPYIIPFSFSSPFVEGKKFKGLSYRTFYRSDKTPLIELKEKNNQKYIEFKAFDIPENIEILTGLIFLIKGIILDKSLTEFRKEPNTEMIKIASLYGFKNEKLKSKILKILDSISKVLKEENKYLDPLFEILQTNKTYSHKMKEKFEITNSILKSISSIQF